MIVDLTIDGVTYYDSATEVEQKVNAVIAELRAENERLRADARRMDWLERVGFETRHGNPNVHSWDGGWTAQTISSECKSAREAIDLAMSKQANP